MIRVLLLSLCAVLTGGCVRGCTSSRPPIHINPNMDQQPRADAQAESGFFYDGATMRLPVEGTVARGDFFEDPSIASGRDASGAFIANPLQLDEAALARGRERYMVFCRPCHGAEGNGQGILFDYGVPVPSFGDERLLGVADGEIFDVISNGKGLMQTYRYALRAEDRWKVIAHLRRLQKAQGEKEAQ